MTRRVGVAAAVLWTVIAANATAQYPEPVDPSAPQGPYSEPLGPATEPRPLDDGPGWTPDGVEAKPEKPDTRPRNQVVRVVHHDDPDAPPNPPAPGFGDAGQFVVTTDFGVGVSSARWEGSDAAQFGAIFIPSFEYFLFRNVSIGVEADFATSTNKGYGADGSLVETKYLLVGGGPHLGVNVRFGRWFSLYPRLMLGIHRVEQTSQLLSGDTLSTAASPTGSPSLTRTGPWISFEAPLLFHAAPHFFLGVGPHVYHDFSRAQGGPDVGAQRTTYGVSFIAGGYWGGAKANSDETEAPKRHFGDQGTVALIGESFSLSWTRYSGTAASLGSITIAPGFDWFAANHLSLGLGVTYSKSDAVGFEPSGRRVTAKFRFVGVHGRLGYEIRLTSWLSLYPRLVLGTGTRVQTLSDGFATNAASAEIVWTALSAPALVHVADHFFIGFGPAISHDLVHSDEEADYPIRNTTIGASTLVGGWL